MSASNPNPNPNPTPNPNPNPNPNQVPEYILQSVLRNVEINADEIAPRLIAPQTAPPRRRRRAAPTSALDLLAQGDRALNLTAARSASRAGSDVWAGGGRDYGSRAGSPAHP